MVRARRPHSCAAEMSGRFTDVSPSAVSIFRRRLRRAQFLVYRCGTASEATKATEGSTETDHARRPAARVQKRAQRTSQHSGGTSVKGVVSQIARWRSRAFACSLLLFPSVVSRSWHDVRMSQNKRLTLNSTKAALISVIEKAQQNRGFPDFLLFFGQISKHLNHVQS